MTSSVFVRDRFTWLAYFMLAYYAYMQATLGPLVPFLRAELDFNYTISGFYVGAYALGMIIAGLTADRMVLRFGRPWLFWGGGAGMAFGSVLLMIGRDTRFTILSTFIMAVIGSYLLVMIQAALSDHHGEKRSYALTEVNVFAVVGATAAPLLVGLGEAQGWTWRLSPLVGIAAWGLAFIWTRRIPIPATRLPRKVEVTEKPGKLPRAYWGYWLVIVISVSIEWCMIFWASTYMEKVVGLDKAIAATSLSLFTLAQVVGRAAGSGLTRRYPTHNLLLLAGAIVVVGFPLFWLGRTPVVNATGLFLCGLGVANLFPLTLSAASAVGTANPNAASGRMTFGAGLAILVAPQILGTLADQIGIQSAYGLVAPLAIGVIAVTWYANRLVVKDRLRPP